MLKFRVIIILVFISLQWISAQNAQLKMYEQTSGIETGDKEAFKKLVQYTSNLYIIYRPMIHRGGHYWDGGEHSTIGDMAFQRLQNNVSFAEEEFSRQGMGNKKLLVKFIKNNLEHIRFFPEYGYWGLSDLKDRNIQVWLCYPDPEDTLIHRNLDIHTIVGWYNSMDPMKKRMMRFDSLYAAKDPVLLLELAKLVYERTGSIDNKIIEYTETLTHVKLAFMDQDSNLTFRISRGGLLIFPKGVTKSHRLKYKNYTILGLGKHKEISMVNDEIDAAIYYSFWLQNYSKFKWDETKNCFVTDQIPVHDFTK